jgi:hypothetical protein
LTNLHTSMYERGHAQLSLFEAGKPQTARWTLNGRKISLLCFSYLIDLLYPRSWVAIKSLIIYRAREENASRLPNWVSCTVLYSSIRFHNCHHQECLSLRTLNKALGT